MLKRNSTTPRALWRRSVVSSRGRKVAAVADQVLVADEFAAAMQQLSAEAAKTLPDAAKKSAGDSDSANLSHEVQALATRLEKFEETVTKKLDQLATSAKKNEPADPTRHFEKIQGQLEAIQSSGTVNHRLFD